MTAASPSTQDTASGTVSGTAGLTAGLTAAEQRRRLVAARLRGLTPDGEHRPGPSAGVPRRPAGTEPPPSFGQERLWFVEQLNPGTAAYVMRAAVRLRGRLDVEQL